MQLNPHELIVPIFAISNNGELIQFLGTGSFVGTPPLLLTAAHVVSDWPEKFSISTVNNLDQLFFAKIVVIDTNHDLALLYVKDYSPPSSLQLAQHLIPQNQLLANFEYGTTRHEGGKIIISPASRIGNITRVLDMSAKYKALASRCWSYLFLL